MTETYTFGDGRRVEVDHHDDGTLTYRLDGRVLDDQAEIDALIKEFRQGGFA